MIKRKRNLTLAICRKFCVLRPDSGKEIAKVKIMQILILLFWASGKEDTSK